MTKGTDLKSQEVATRLAAVASMSTFFFALWKLVSDSADVAIPVEVSLLRMKRQCESWGPGADPIAPTAVDNTLRYTCRR